MKIFLQVSVSGTKEQQDLLLPSMLELGCRGFEETGTRLVGYFEEPADAGAAQRLRDALFTVLRKISANAEISFGELADRNWNEEWERTIRPIEIGERIAIRPSWRGYSGPAERIVLTIDPKMSFGTGYHETTRLMLRLVEKYLRPGSVVLDIGTGTGVLAIAAARLGAASAVGTDTDGWAVENARENVALNGVRDRVRICHGTLPGGSSFVPSMICANLTLNDHLQLLPRYREILSDGGRLLISGLLASDEATAGRALSGAGFRTVETLRENEWLAICAE